MEPFSCIRSNFGLDMRDVRRSSNPNASCGRKSKRDRQLSPTGILPPASIVQVGADLGLIPPERAVGGLFATVLARRLSRLDYKAVDGRVLGVGGFSEIATPVK